jgi:hypothetical protein
MNEHERILKELRAIFSGESQNESANLCTLQEAAAVLAPMQNQLDELRIAFYDAMTKVIGELP